ncbi:MAG: hypothetical protein U5K51_05145 [Flavobacteriaceae bacterium]|nr:hypothetical protein [Flavobacteriaceae bacterium]
MPLIAKHKILNLVGLLFFFLPGTTAAQCAMCRAVVESGGEEVAEGINSGIIYLMAFPYLIVAVAFYFLFRYYRKSGSK